MLNGEEENVWGYFFFGLNVDDLFKNKSKIYIEFEIGVFVVLICF